MKEYTGGCHCGGVKYKFKSDQSVEIWNCNCSICDMINYQHLFVKHELFELIAGEELLLEYKFESGSAKHFFAKDVESNRFINQGLILKCIALTLNVWMIHQKLKRSFILME